MASDANTSLPGLLFCTSPMRAASTWLSASTVGLRFLATFRFVISTWTAAMTSPMSRRRRARWRPAGSNLGIFLSDGAGNFTARPTLSTGAGPMHKCRRLTWMVISSSIWWAAVFYPTSAERRTAIGVFANQGMANYPTARASYTTLAQPFCDVGW